MASKKSSNIKAYRTYGFEEYGLRLLCFIFLRNLIFFSHVKILYRCSDIVGSNREHTWSKSRKQQSPWDFIYPKEIFI